MLVGMLLLIISFISLVFPQDFMLVSGVVDKVEDHTIYFKPVMCPDRHVELKVKGMIPKLKEGDKIYFVTEENPCVVSKLEVNNIKLGGFKR